MKLRTWFVAATSGAVGYVFGTAAGRARFEQLKTRVQSLAQDPKVQQNLSKVASSVSESADKMNSPVGGVLKSAATKVQSSVQPGAGSAAGTGGPAGVSDLGGMSDLGDLDGPAGMSSDSTGVTPPPVAPSDI